MDSITLCRGFLASKMGIIKIHTTWGCCESKWNITWQGFGAALAHRKFLINVLIGSFFVVVVVQPLSCVWLCNPVDCSTPGVPIHHHLPELTQTYAHWVSDAIQPSHPLSSPSPPALNLSQHQGFSKESVLHIRWPKYWSFSFNISPCNEYSGLISFRMGWLDLLAVQRTLKSLLQHHSSKASILQCSAFLWSSSHICTWLLEKP